MDYIKKTFQKQVVTINVIENGGIKKIEKAFIGRIGEAGIKKSIKKEYGLGYEIESISKGKVTYIMPADTFIKNSRILETVKEGG